MYGHAIPYFFISPETNIVLTLRIFRKSSKKSSMVGLSSSLWKDVSSLTSPSAGTLGSWRIEEVAVFFRVRGEERGGGGCALIT